MDFVEYLTLSYFDIDFHHILCVNVIKNMSAKFVALTVIATN